MERVDRIKMSYEVVVTADKNQGPPLPTTDEQTSGRWTTSTYTVLQGLNLSTKTVDFDKRGSADAGSSKVQEMLNLNSENTGEALGKPRGFGQCNVGTISALIELLCFYYYTVDVDVVQIVHERTKLRTLDHLEPSL